MLLYSENVVCVRPLEITVAPKDASLSDSFYKWNHGHLFTFQTELIKHTFFYWLIKLYRVELCRPTVRLYEPATII